MENLESVFFNRFGQYIYREPRGRHAGYPLPEVGIHRGKLHRILVIYPIVDNINGEQLINWMAEIEGSGSSMNDWNSGGRIDDFLPIFKDWQFDWLDVPALIRNADQVLQYPMVDKDPVAQSTFGRVTLMGDAAHPMYPRGSNGSA